jgi:hypothetical protein
VSPTAAIGVVVSTLALTQLKRVLLTRHVYRWPSPMGTEGR